jgi:hypothetical protein
MINGISTTGARVRSARRVPDKYACRFARLCYSFWYNFTNFRILQTSTARSQSNLVRLVDIIAPEMNLALFAIF